MKKTYKAALSGILLSLSAAMSFLESFIPLPLGVKPGFSNIPVMFSMSEINVGISFSICILKSVFVFLTRGTTAFFMSLSGGLLSFLIMLLLFKKTKASFLFISVLGSLFHNTGQIITAVILLDNTAVLSYMPVLIISGCICGIATGIVIQIIIPVLKPIIRRNK